MNAPINEIFTSIQGEGKCVGCRQLFIRFIGCNLNCSYCDTPQGKLLDSVCRGPEEGQTLPNPASLNDVLDCLRRMDNIPVHSISLTGGEPLLHTDFINALTSSFPHKYFLETNGTLVEALKKVIKNIDIVSMDMKMPDAVGKKLWREHEEFLALARQKDVYVKIVVAEETKLTDFDQALNIIRSIDPNILLILQPMTPYGGYTAPKPYKMLSWQAMALKKLNDVRVIPQTHKMIGQR